MCLFINQSCRSLGIASALLMTLCGCGTKIVANKPALPYGGRTDAIGKGTMTFYRWADQPTVMICSDIQPGTQSMNESSTSGPPAVRNARGLLSDDDGHKIEWLLQEKDNKEITLQLQGKDFDLNNGRLLLVKTKSGTTEIEQIRQDLSSVKLNTDSLKAFARETPAIKELLEFAEE